MSVVLVGADHSGEGRAAIEAGIEEARRREAEVHFVHHVRLGPDEQVLIQRNEGQRLLDDAEARAERAGLTHRATLDLDARSAAHALLTHAESEDAAVIVIGTRRRSRVSKALIGGDAQQVIIGAHCQVLCVKGEDDADSPRP